MCCGRRNDFISKPTSLKYYRYIVYVQYTFNSIECLGKLHSTDLDCDYILLSQNGFRPTLRILSQRGGDDYERRRKPCNMQTVFMHSEKSFRVFVFVSTVNCLNNASQNKLSKHKKIHYTNKNRSIFRYALIVDLCVIWFLSSIGLR